MARGARGYIPPDGVINRSIEDEKKLNEMIALAMSDDAGQRVMKYLKSITTGTVFGPDFDPNQLIHREGARWLVGVLEQRIAYGKEKRPHVHEKEK
jgi:hypothetical protein